MHGDKSLVKLALPRDRNSIRRSTYLLRQKLGLKDTPYFPIVEFLENVLPEIDPTFHIEILEDLELPGVQMWYELKTLCMKRQFRDIGGLVQP